MISSTSSWLIFAWVVAPYLFPFRPLTETCRNTSTLRSLVSREGSASFPRVVLATIPAARLGALTPPSQSFRG